MIEKEKTNAEIQNEWLKKHQKADLMSIGYSGREGNRGKTMKKKKVKAIKEIRLVSINIHDKKGNSVARRIMPGMERCVTPLQLIK